MKFSCGLKPRSRRVVQDSTMAVADKAEEIGGSRPSSWGNFPQELLREVLTRVEASESSWPLRRNVVACAGVCRSWREVVGTPEVSGKSTFPISVERDCVVVVGCWSFGALAIGPLLPQAAEKPLLGR